jgi:hypothetical protein
MAYEKFSAGHGTFQTERTGMVQRVLDAWKDMRASTRRLIDEDPSEARLLFYVLMSDMVFFLSWTLKAVVRPSAGAESIIPNNVALLMVGALLLRTAAIYVFTLILGSILRLFGGTGTWKATRAGVFWGSFVSAPFGLLAAVVAVILTTLEPSHPWLKESWVALPPYWIGLIPFTWFISYGIAEAQGLEKASFIFMVLSVLAIISVIGGMYLRAIGVL